MSTSVASRAGGLVMLALAALAVLALTGVTANDSDPNIENTTNYKLPELYQIDDYDRCLSRPGGLYCVGTFRLTADRQAPSYRYYRMIEKYSSEPRHFNRTLLHRGYCLSSRCPDLANATHRDWFSSCAQTQEESLGLKLDLQSYHCRHSYHNQASEAQYRALGDNIFLWVIAVLLALNILGTLYDFKVTESDGEKNTILMSWSIRSNWQSLKNTLQKHKDPRVERLSSLAGIKAMCHILFITGHVMVAYHQAFLSNPESMEQLYFCCYHLSFPLMISWIMCGEWFFERRSPLTTAVYAAIERPIFLILLTIYVTGLTNNLDNLVSRLALWRYWRPLDRLTLPVLTVHWCIIKTLLASRRGLIDVNVYNMSTNILTTMFLSYCIAMPLTVLVEMPLIKIYNAVEKK